MSREAVKGTLRVERGTEGEEFTLVVNKKTCDPKLLPLLTALQACDMRVLLEERYANMQAVVEAAWETYTTSRNTLQHTEPWALPPKEESVFFEHVFNLWLGSGWTSMKVREDDGSSFSESGDAERKQNQAFAKAVTKREREKAEQQREEEEREAIRDRLDEWKQLQEETEQRRKRMERDIKELTEENDKSAERLAQAEREIEEDAKQKKEQAAVAEKRLVAWRKQHIQGLKRRLQEI